MNDNCFEIGIIQAFLDGETSPDLSFKISGHMADCDNCARAMAEAEEESSLVFSVLDREFNSMVPTQRLWTSINESLAYEKNRTSFWDKVRVFGVYTVCESVDHGRGERFACVWDICGCVEFEAGWRD